MTNRTWHVTGHCTLGYLNLDKPEVSISLRGPRGGDLGGGCCTPAEARALAQELLDAADIVDPPRSIPEHNLYFRGYEIEPLVDPEETGGWTPVEWWRATCFRIYPPDPNKPVLDCAPETLNAAREAVIEDIKCKLTSTSSTTARS